MTSPARPIKRTVAAFLLTVGFSLPAAAETLDEMFDKLAASADAEEAARIEDRIVDAWSRSGSPSMDLLLSRGAEALEATDFRAAVEHFTAAIDHSPDFAEAYHGRATAFYLMGYYGPALDDLRQTLALNPRHFTAMRGFGIIAEELGRDEEALRAYRRALAIHPHMQQIDEAARRLEEKLSGRSL